MAQGKDYMSGGSGRSSRRGTPRSKNASVPSWMSSVEDDAQDESRRAYAMRSRAAQHPQQRPAQQAQVQRPTQQAQRPQADPRFSQQLPTAEAPVWGQHPQQRPQAQSRPQTRRPAAQPQQRPAAQAQRAAAQPQTRPAAQQASQPPQAQRRYQNPAYSQQQAQQRQAASQQPQTQRHPHDAHGTPRVDARAAGEAAYAHRVGAPASRYEYESRSPQAQGARSPQRPKSHAKPQEARKRSFSFVPVVLLAVVAIVVAVFVFIPPFFSVTVNGTSYTVNAGTTIDDLISKGWASPTAGNLLAVDGTIWTAGGGKAFSATVNGNQTDDGTTRVSRGDVVEISDGADVTEDYTETTETIAHGTSGDSMSFASYWAGSIHLYTEGSDGEKTIKTGSLSGLTTEEVTKEAVDSGYHNYTTDTHGEKVIALTFDDGPWSETTAEILDILKENGAHATFFQIGYQIANYPELEQRIHDEGHQIATHTYDHASGSGGGTNLTKMTSEEQREEVTKGFQAIEDSLGISVSRIMRAPGGNYYGDTIENLKDLVTAEIGWDVDTEDWRKPGADAIAEAILSVQPGQVILMHDGGGDRSQTVEALRTALPQLVEQGYSFVTIDELLAYGIPSSDS